MDAVDDMDTDAKVLRFLCETAEDRLEHMQAAHEIAHRTTQMPDGTYFWARSTEIEEVEHPAQPR